MGAGAVVAAIVAAGCTTTDGSATEDATSSVASAAGSSDAGSSEAGSCATAAATPTGAPVGTAVMKVDGGGTVTLRYTINGGPEQTEINVTLPWEKTYDAHNQISSSVSVDSGGREVMCTITFNRNMLVSHVTKPDPTCTFAYY